MIKKHAIWCVLAVFLLMASAVLVIITGIALAEKYYTVSFDPGGNGPVPPQIIAKGGLAERPPDPVKLRPGLFRGTVEDHYAVYAFGGWFVPGSEIPFDFDSTAVNSNITLTARWTEPGPPRIAAVPPNDIGSAFDFLVSNPGRYTLLISQDIESSGHSIALAHRDLTIRGIGGERNIQFTGCRNSRLLNLNHVNSRLTLGNNITLRGIDNSATNLVNLQNGMLTMKPGSKITGHTTSGYAAALVIGSGPDGSLFLMEGGSISGNISTRNSSMATGGVYVIYPEQFEMSGGSISGNYNAFNAAGNNNPADVFVWDSVITISGTAQIGSLTMNKPDGNLDGAIILGGAFVGGVYTLNLRLHDVICIHTIISEWTAANVFVLRAAEGHSLTSADIARFRLGQFLTCAGGNTVNYAQPKTGNLPESEFSNFRLALASNQARLVRD